ATCTGYVVVRHDVDEVEHARELRQLEVADFVGPRGCSDRQLVLPAGLPLELIELAPVLLHEQREVAVVIRTVAVLRKTAGDREFPVDIDTVEQTGVAAQEDVDRGCDEPLPRGGRCRSVREPARAAPAAERDDQLQVGMASLEVAQPCEGAAGRAARTRRGRTS